MTILGDPRATKRLMVQIAMVRRTTEEALGVLEVHRAPKIPDTVVSRHPGIAKAEVSIQICLTFQVWRMARRWTAIMLTSPG
jgi:hypothetical protein